MDSRFCSLTACLKNAKNTKGQSAICEGLCNLVCYFSIGFDWGKQFWGIHSLIQEYTHVHGYHGWKASYPGIPTMTRPKVEFSLGWWHDHHNSLVIYQQVWPPHVQYIFDHCRGINLEWNWMNLNGFDCCVRRHEIVKLCDIELLELVATTF